MTTLKAYNVGQAAYYDDKFIDDCPYTVGCEEYDEWTAGYLDEERYDIEQYGRLMRDCYPYYRMEDLI